MRFPRFWPQWCFTFTGRAVPHFRNFSLAECAARDFGCLGVASVCGLLNGGMIVALDVHPFIITLGTMAIFRGIAFVITKGQSIGEFPEAFRTLVRREVGDGLSLVPLGVMVLIAVIGGIYLSRQAAGRRVYAIGGNELASRLAVFASSASNSACTFSPA